MNGWHVVNQPRRVTDWSRRGGGNGRAEGLSAIGDGAQIAASRTPDIHGTVLVPCSIQFSLPS